MKRLLIVLLVLLAGCSSEESAMQGFNAFARPCDRHTWKWAITTNNDGTQTFTATCKVKP
jgi:hypothetical protein